MLATWMRNNSLDEHINKLSVISLTFAVYFALVGNVAGSCYFVLFYCCSFEYKIYMSCLVGSKSIVKL